MVANMCKYVSLFASLFVSRFNEYSHAWKSLETCSTAVVCACVSLVPYQYLTVFASDLKCDFWICCIIYSILSISYNYDCFVRGG